jgi:hypothetical protein
MFPCPRHHTSETADFCSVCGISLSEVATDTQPSPSVAPAPPAAGGCCPECDTSRASPRQVYCEVCGYNFQTKTSGVPPAEDPSMAAALAENASESDLSALQLELVASEAAPAPAAQAEPPVVQETPVPAVTSTAANWSVEVCVDPNLYGTHVADAPINQPKQTFMLFNKESLIGRAGTEVRVHVPIGHDHGVSRRHAMLTLQPDGGLVVRDLGSANGTQLNGKDVVPGVDTPVSDGDALGIGAWTRITVHGSGSPTRSRP